MIAEVARAALSDLAMAYKMLSGQVRDADLPEVPGEAVDKVRKQLVLECLGRAGDMLKMAVDVQGQADMVLSMLAGPGPMQQVDVDVEDKEPFGFALAVKRMNESRQVA